MIDRLLRIPEGKPGTVIATIGLFFRLAYGVSLVLLPKPNDWHGLFTWTPRVAVAIAGLVPLFRQHRRVGLVVAVSLLVAWYVNAAVADCGQVRLLGVARLWKRDRAVAVLLGGNVLTMLLFYAQLGNWMGGRSYGPRYLVPVLPLPCVGLAPLVAHKRGLRWVAAIAAVSVVVQLPGVLVDYAKVSVAHARDVGAPSRVQRLTDWQTSPLVLNARASVRLLPANVGWLIGTSARPAPVGTTPAGRGEFSQQFVYSLDFWWMYLFHMRALSATAVGGVALGFVAGLCTLLVALWRSVPGGDASIGGA